MSSSSLIAYMWPIRLKFRLVRTRVQKNQRGVHFKQLDKCEVPNELPMVQDGIQQVTASERMTPQRLSE